MSIASHSVRVTLGVLLALVLALLIAMLALRLALPHWDGMHAWVEETASERLDRRVTADGVELGWAGWSPALVARDVRVEMPGGEPVAIERLGVSLSAGASLRSRHPAFAVRIEGVELRLVRHADGQFSLHGREIGMGEGRVLTIPVAQWPDVEAEAVRLTWEDRGAGLESSAQLARAALRTAHDGSLRLYLDGALDAGGSGAAGGDFELGLQAPAADLRDGRFFLRADAVDLTAWQPWLAYLGWPAPEGSASLRLWGALADGRMVWLRGDHETTLNLAGEPVGPAIGHRFDWRVRDGRHQSSWSGTRPGSGDLRLAYRLEGEPRELVVDGVELAARDVEVEPYSPLLTLLREAAPELAERIAELHPRGTLSVARFEARREEGRLQPVWAEADVHDLGWRAAGVGLGVQGAAGYLQWRRGGVELLLDSRDLEVVLPRVLADPVALDVARGRLRAERDDAGHWHLAGEGLQAANSDAAVRGRMRMRLDGHEAGPRVDISMDILRADGERTAHYLPLYHLPENTYQWLVDSIVTGVSTGGGMVYRGRGKDFPFADGEGVFDLWADVEAGILDYQEGWPRAEDLAGRLLFHNASFRAEGARGRILDTEVSDTRIGIRDMENAVLELEGAAEGDAADLLTYLRQADLLEDAAELRDQARLDGPTRLGLSLTLPLQEGRMDETRVAGDLDLRGTRAEVPGWPAVLEDVEGRVRFDTADRIRAEGVTARVHNETVTLGADWPLDGEMARLTASGMQPLGPWLEDYPQLAPYLEGSAHWEARLRLGPAVDGVRLDLNSDLAGVAIDWPEPIGKPAEEVRPLELTLPLGHDGAGIGHLTLGSVLRAHMRLSPTAAPEDPAVRGAEPRTAARGIALQSMALEIGAPSASALALPGAGVSVRARLPELMVDPWLEALSEAPWDGEVDLGAGGEDGGQTNGAVALTRLELDIRDRVRWGEHALPGLRFLGRRGAAGWDLEVASDWLAGEARWRPMAAGGRDRWEAHLSYLVLEDLEWDGEARPDPEVKPVAAGTFEDPRVWPAVDLTLDSLVLGDYRFADIELGLEPQTDGLVVRDLEVRAPDGDLHADAVGVWEIGHDGLPESRLDVTLSGDDWGAAMRSAGLSRALVGGSGEGSLSLNWPGPLYAPRLALLAGSMELALEDGRLADVEPGAGRLLGLVSLDVLPRRLRLDFRDVFTEGLTFGELTADATLRDGDLYVPALRMEGPSARVRLSGRTGLVARDYDHEIVVVPSLRTALPIVGALVGGPVTGVVVLLAERVLGIGDQIEEAARVEYAVTGPWDDPQVRVLVEPAADTDGTDND
ncbi:MULTISPECIES: YhdP family protein [unclassified Thioalkalivibrio]|uniref:YhdP family protein n=1 Tax=unclassified Thioalkalivibrio TaxID=2621013 RepID=UPI0003A7E3B2|nr:MULTISPECIES: YhdP family protein [unclassified Thioalkalivibrio]